jgi:hypothetical protein
MLLAFRRQTFTASGLTRLLTCKISMPKVPVTSKRARVVMSQEPLVPDSVRGLAARYNNLLDLLDILFLPPAQYYHTHQFHPRHLTYCLIHQSTAVVQDLTLPDHLQQFQRLRQAIQSARCFASDSRTACNSDQSRWGFFRLYCHNKMLLVVRRSFLDPDFASAWLGMSSHGCKQDPRLHCRESQGSQEHRDCGGKGGGDRWSCSLFESGGERRCSGCGEREAKEKEEDSQN